MFEYTKRKYLECFFLNQCKFKENVKKLLIFFIAFLSFSLFPFLPSYLSLPLTLLCTYSFMKINVNKK